MKRKVVFILMLFVIVSCRDTEYRYYTRINADGSIYKKVTAVGDSSKIYNQPFSFDIANDWKLSYDTEIDKEKGDTLYMAIAEKTFESIKELNEDFNQKVDSSHVDNIEIKMDSQFRWFFTFYTYKEVFKQRFPFRHVSIDDFLNDEEYAYFLEGDTSCIQSMTEKEEEAFDEAGEKKFWDYLSISVSLELMRLLNNYAVEYHQKKLESRDSILINDLFLIGWEASPDLEEMCKILDEQKDVEWISVAYQEGCLSNFEKQIEDELVFFDESIYSSEIDVVGFLYDTNAKEIKDNTAKWKFNRGYFSYKDYTSYVSYRTTNYWAFVFTILVTLTLLMSFIKRNKR